MTNSFTYFKVNDLAKPQTVDETFKRFAIFAGLFEYTSVDIHNINNWLSPGDLTIVGDSISWTGNSVAEGTWKTKLYQGLTSTDDPNKFGPIGRIIEFDVTQNDWGFVVYSGVGAGQPPQYLVGVNSSSQPFLAVTYYSGGAVFDEMRLINDVAVPTTAHVVIAARQLTFGGDANDTWVAISMFMNGELVLSWIDKPVTIDSSGNTTVSTWFGLAARNGIDVTYENITVKEMGQFIDDATIDPGESSMSGLSRSVQGYFYKMWLRHDGTLKVVKPKKQDSQATIDQGIIESFNRQVDKRELKSHIRQVGAYTEAEYISGDLIDKIGHRFDQVNNPFLLTQAECLDEAQQVIKRRQSDADQVSFTIPAKVLLELEDRITLDAADYIISSISLNITSTEIEESITARKYVYG